MAKKEWFFWLLGSLLIVAFIGGSVLGAFGDGRDPELVKFNGIASIRRSEFITDLQRIRRYNQAATAEECINGMIQERIKKAFCKELSLNCSEDAIMNLLQKLPHFLDKDGKFDESKFNAELTSQGLSRSQYLGYLRSELLYNLSAQILCSVYNPQYLTAALAEARLMKRDLSVAYFNNVAPVPEPSEKDLLNTYQAYSKEFVRPETRSIKYFLVNRTPTANISDASIREYFRQNFAKSKVSLQSARDKIVKALTKAKDQATLDSIRSGISELASEKEFSALATKFSSKLVSLRNVNLKEIARSKIFVSVADRVFAAKKLNCADVAVLKDHILAWYVTEVSPARALQFAEVKHLARSKFISLKRQEISTKKAVKLHSSLVGSKLNSVKFATEAKRAGAEIVELDGVGPTRPNGKYFQAVWGLGEGEISSIISEPGKSCILFVKKLHPTKPKPQDVSSMESAVKNSMYFELREYLLSKYKPKIVSPEVSQYN